jgi:hypothetical protein
MKIHKEPGHSRPGFFIFAGDDLCMSILRASRKRHTLCDSIFSSCSLQLRPTAWASQSERTFS